MDNGPYKLDAHSSLRIQDSHRHVRPDSTVLYQEQVIHESFIGAPNEAQRVINLSRRCYPLSISFQCSTSIQNPTQRWEPDMFVDLYLSVLLHIDCIGGNTVRYVPVCPSVGPNQGVLIRAKTRSRAL